MSENQPFQKLDAYLKIDKIFKNDKVINFTLAINLEHEKENGKVREIPTYPQFTVFANNNEKNFRLIQNAKEGDYIRVLAYVTKQKNTYYVQKKDSSKVLWENVLIVTRVVA